MRQSITDKQDVYNALNEGLLHTRYRLLLSNIRRNRGAIDTDGGLRPIVPMLSGNHLLVVGAGASLDAHHEFLETLSYASRVKIIAVDAALRPLLMRGICPDYVITCEAAAHDFLAAADCGDMHLLAFCGSHPSVIRRWAGAKSFYTWMIKGDPWDTLWKEAGNSLGAVGTGSTVSSQALALALGCAPLSICLVGNDFAYRHSYYCRGTLQHGNLTNAADRLFPLAGRAMAQCRRARSCVVRRDEKDYFSHEQFLAAKYWCEDVLKTTNIPVADFGQPGLDRRFAGRPTVNEYISFVRGIA